MAALTDVVALLCCLKLNYFLLSLVGFRLMIGLILHNSICTIAIKFDMRKVWLLVKSSFYWPFIYHIIFEFYFKL